MIKHADGGEDDVQQPVEGETKPEGEGNMPLDEDEEENFM